MSEVNIAKRKEKCENCTKQVNFLICITVNLLHCSQVNEGSQLLLSACLSCDGCLSEGESLKISQQSLEAVEQVLALNKKCDVSKHKVLVVSVCPQSLPFFAVKFGLDISEAAHKLCGFLKSLGVQYVFDTTLAAGFSILESQKEFIQRYRRRHHDSHALPMFTSSCPGWIRYSERVLGSLVTPHICTAKSPQQIMGGLVKDYFSKQQSERPCHIFMSLKSIFVLSSFLMFLLLLFLYLDCTLTGTSLRTCYHKSHPFLFSQTQYAASDVMSSSVHAGHLRAVYRSHMRQMAVAFK
uniref:Iron hydrogenase large subunit C-terminal domain-containing protein n=1 Tax=Monopterus albus TaxID=43700 RepID=A0A3Q3PZ70_MONAL